MKVAAHLPLYPPGSLVGAWLSTHQCLAGMADRGHQVKVTTYLSGPRFPYTIDGVEVSPKAPVDLGCDVMVSHLGDNQEASKAAKAAGVPSVRMVHGIPTANQRLDDDLAVFNSQSLADHVGWDGPSVVVHPPVRGDDYRTTPGDMVTLINLTPNKGGYLFWKLAERFPDVQFLGVRGGYGPQVVRRLPNVEVIQPTPDIRDLVYARTRILLMPSQNETWGRTAIEAAHSGIPTIASPTPGLVESLGDGGIFVPQIHTDGWVENIRLLLDPARWILASRRALARAVELDPTDDINRFCDSLESLAAQRTAA